MNKIYLTGNLTRAPEVRNTSSGKAYARLGIAVNRPFSRDKDAVDFFNLVAWDKTAEFIGKYFSKGSRILIEGRLQTSKYKGKDGNEVTSTDIVIENVEFAGGGGKAKPKDNFDGESIDDDDIPFV